MIKVGLEFRSWVSAIGTSEAARGGSLFVYPDAESLYFV